MDFIRQLIAWISRIFAPAAAPLAPQPQGALPQPITRKVMMIVFDPFIPDGGTQRLSQYLNWSDADALANQYIQDLQTCSHGYLTYQIVEKMTVDGFPVKKDGFAYSVSGYLQAWQNQTGFHQPDLADYARILSDFNIVQKINSGIIDEVWFFGMPYAGFYESVMVGAGAFFVNAPPLAAAGVQRSFIIMGFNYQRGVGEMLEAFGHRAEFVLGRVFRNLSGNANLWERFTRYDKLHPGQAECGTVHFAPNSQMDYDWGNTTFVPSRCRNWLKFPDLSDPPVMVNCAEWGNGEIRQHHIWWLRLFPHLTGRSNGISWNWWEYVADPGRVR
ncbi:hypothetical protein [Bellilinea sp.]|uniref:hypothetical protein n=1 Tax=Bellilinea sp. TaxID=2838785 RepID=UPI002ADE1FFE|nr:hypothetical protein [Bellilinea sp.]